MSIQAASYLLVDFKTREGCDGFSRALSACMGSENVHEALKASLSEAFPINFTLVNVNDSDEVAVAGVDAVAGRPDARLLALNGQDAINVVFEMLTQLNAWIAGAFFLEIWDFEPEFRVYSSEQRNWLKIKGLPDGSEILYQDADYLIDENTLLGLVGRFEHGEIREIKTFRKFRIDGTRFSDFDSLIRHFLKVFGAEEAYEEYEEYEESSEDYEGSALETLRDVMCGHHGVIRAGEKVKITWSGRDKSAALVDSYYRARLDKQMGQVEAELRECDPDSRLMHRNELEGLREERESRDFFADLIECIESEGHELVFKP